MFWGERAERITVILPLPASEHSRSRLALGQSSQLAGVFPRTGYYSVAEGRSGQVD